MYFRGPGPTVEQWQIVCASERSFVGSLKPPLGYAGFSPSVKISPLTRVRLFAAGGMLLKPQHVLVARRGRRQRQMKIQAIVGLRAAIAPLVHFGMAIAEIEATR